jgi:hypothetical protein
MRGQRLTPTEAVAALLRHYDDEVASGVPELRAVQNVAAEYGIAEHKVLFFVEDRDGPLVDIPDTVPEEWSADAAG